MDIATASGLVAGQERVTLLPEIRAQLAAKHASAPQRAMLAQVAMDEIEHGLAELAKLGDQFVLAAPVALASKEDSKTSASAGSKRS